MRLYNGKWEGISDRSKYQDIRDKITNSFKDLIFEEGPHKYYLHGKEITCVSNVTHMFQEHFDADTKAEETSERNWDNPESKYYHMTAEEIKTMWKQISEDACCLGTNRHNFGESCFYFMIGKYDRIVPDFADRLKKDENGNYYMESIYPKEDAVVKFWQDLPRSFVPIAAENKVYDEEMGYSGTFDILFYYDPTIEGMQSSNEGLVIFDYKTNKDLYKNFKEKKLLKPFDGLLDMPLSIYKLQLSLYQNCLQQIGLTVKGRRLIWLLPDGSYSKIPLEEYVNTLRKELKKKKLNII